VTRSSCAARPRWVGGGLRLGGEAHDASSQVTREVLQAGKGRLKVVGRAGVGIDNVDLGAATESGVLVVNAPTANTIAAAEHGIALLCALARNVAQADASMKARAWAARER
jgi:D-3-phosphoglycerate dehydrogenase